MKVSLWAKNALLAFQSAHGRDKRHGPRVYLVLHSGQLMHGELVELDDHALALKMSETQEVYVATEAVAVWSLDQLVAAPTTVAVSIKAPE